MGFVNWMGCICYRFGVLVFVIRVGLAFSGFEVFCRWDLPIGCVFVVLLLL